MSTLPRQQVRSGGNCYFSHSFPAGLRGKHITIYIQSFALLDAIRAVIISDWAAQVDALQATKNSSEHCQLLLVCIFAWIELRVTCVVEPLQVSTHVMSVAL